MHIDGFLAYTIGIVVFFIGMNVNRRVAVLRDYNIPEPVTGGQRIHGGSARFSQRGGGYCGSRVQEFSG